MLQPLFVASLALAGPPRALIVSAAGLKLQKPCGDFECQAYHYCDTAQSLCRACEPVCNVSSNRYHPDECEPNCQDYIHDFVQGYARGNNVPLDMINTIYWQQNVILVLVVVLVGLVGGKSVRSWYRYFKTRRQRRIDDKRFKEKLASVQYTINNNIPLNDGNIKCLTAPALRSTLPSTMTLTTTQTEMTPCSTNHNTNTNGANRQNASRTLPLSNEEPSEDATLDYASYVNQCLSHSPSTEANLGGIGDRRY